MFRDDLQTARAMRVLCGRLPRLASAWSDEGPSRQAVEWFDADGGPLSSGERVVLLAAFSFWNGGLDAEGKGRLRFTEILDALDGDHRRCLAELMIAAGEGTPSVEAWMAKWRLRAV